jgi:hypothetical protein
MDRFQGARLPFTSGTTIVYTTIRGKDVRLAMGSRRHQIDCIQVLVFFEEKRGRFENPDPFASVLLPGNWIGGGDGSGG